MSMFRYKILYCNRVIDDTAWNDFEKAKELLEWYSIDCIKDGGSWKYFEIKKVFISLQ